MINNVQKQKTTSDHIKFESKSVFKMLAFHIIGIAILLCAFYYILPYQSHYKRAYLTVAEDITRKNNTDGSESVYFHVLNETEIDVDKAILHLYFLDKQGIAHLADTQEFNINAKSVYWALMFISAEDKQTYGVSKVYAKVFWN